jgi:hypothetical protein
MFCTRLPSSYVERFRFGIVEVIDVVGQSSSEKFGLANRQILGGEVTQRGAGTGTPKI